MENISQIEDKSASGEPDNASSKRVRWLLVAGAPAAAAAFAAVLFLAGPVSNMVSGWGSSEETEVESLAQAAGRYVELPEMVANLSSGTRPRFVKMRITVRAADPMAASKIANRERELLDVFNGYMQALDADEVFGAAGFERLRAGLRRRAQLALGADAEGMEDLLIVEFVRQ